MSKVYIVGSINVDLVGFADRLPVPGETIRGGGFERFPGGKGANQAVAAASAGARTEMVGAVGADSFGEYMLDNLRTAGIGTDRVVDCDTATGVALIIVGGGENQIVVIPGANDRIDPAAIDAIDFAPGDVCLAQLETDLDVVRRAFERASAMGAHTIFNPAPASEAARSLLQLAEIIVVNETECALFAGSSFDFDDAAAEAERAVARLDLRTDQALVVTGGAGGAVAVADGRMIRVAGHCVPVVDTTGAGDCFCGYLAAGVARGEPISAVLCEANAAAALAVQRKGAASSIPKRAEVATFLERMIQNAQPISASVF